MTPFFFLIAYEGQYPKVFPLHKLPKELYFKTALFSKYPAKKVFTRSISFKKQPISFNIYDQAFLKVKQEINKGNSYLLNLTFPTPINTNLSLKEFFLRSNSPYKLLYKDEFVCFSPESFIKINKGKIFSYPMKGTIDAVIPNAKKIILNDKKETAEHFTIVDLIRNDLSKIAKKVRVEKLRYIEKIETDSKNLLQVSSEISGILPDNYKQNIGNIIASLLPAGSICGAPKKSTLAIIKQIETYKRGYYTGVMGVFDGENLDSAVLIRFIENKNNNFIYKSGGGITSLSQALSEYQELINKVYVPFSCKYKNFK